MAQRRLPVRPNLEQLRHQAKELLREIRRGDPVAVALLSMPPHDPADVKLAQAQTQLARFCTSAGGLAEGALRALLERAQAAGARHRLVPQA